MSELRNTDSEADKNSVKMCVIIKPNCASTVKSNGLLLL